MRTRGGWQLWRDWCAAASVDPADVSDLHLARFQHDVTVSRRQLAELRATARERGDLEPAALPDPWAGIEADFEPLQTCLRSCRRSGWPAGYRGRRDAWLLLLTRGLRLTRRRALDVTARDLQQPWTLVGKELTRGDAPATCHRCVAVRWLQCRQEEHDWGRSSVGQLLVAATAFEHQHLCAQRDLGTSALPDWITLAPSLDQHGWISSTHRRLDQNDRDSTLVQAPMTPRSLTCVLATRCLPGPRSAASGQEGGPAEVQGPLREVSDIDPGAHPDSDREFDETTLDRLDEACDRADEINARVAALLAEVASDS